MGGGNEQSIEQTFNLSAVTKSLTTTITNYQISMSAALESRQDLNISAGDILEGCKLIISQTIDSDVNSSTEMSDTTINQAKTEVKKELSAGAQAAMEKVTEAGNMQFGDSQSMEQEVNMAIEDVIDTTFETNSLNESITKAVNVQKGTITFGNCIKADVDISQNITAKLMAEAISKSLVTNISDNTVLSTLHADLAGEAKTENKGIADIVGTFFEGLTGPMKYAMIASVVCCCMIVVLVVVMGLSPAGQKGMGNLSAAGAARMGGRKF
jgi:hypothetical protein